MRLRITPILITAWAATVVGSLYAMAKYESTPGAGLAARDIAFTPTLRSSDKPTLLMFVHPRCSCSAASMEELSTLMARCGDRVNASVLFYQPSTEAAGWSHTALWRDAADIPGVAVTTDVDARQARRCGAQTSGQVVLYSPSGKVLYEGGLTASRGHVGDNDGLDAIEHLLLTPPAADAPPVHASVFGCAIYSTRSADAASAQK